jgi:putative transposase
LKIDKRTHFQEDVILGLVRKKREIWKRGSGRNLHHALKKDLERHNLKIGQDKFFDFLRTHQLLVKPKRYRTKTTCGFYHFNKYDNLIQGKMPSRANEIRVSDITYLWLKALDKFCYLSLITDLYSRKIAGYCVHEDLSVNGCTEALKMALKQRENKASALTPITATVAFNIAAIST